MTPPAQPPIRMLLSGLVQDLAECAREADGRGERMAAEDFASAARRVTEILRRVAEE